MKKTILFILCLIVLCQTKAQIYIDNQGNIFDQRKQVKDNTNSQDTQKKPIIDLSKLELGGNFGLQFGDYTHISISPQIGYKVSKYTSLGIGLGYSYLSDNYYDSSIKYNDKFSALTFGTYARIYPVESFVLSAQPEVSRVWRSTQNRGYKFSDTHVAPTLLIGGGFVYEGMMVMLQYDILQNKYSPYGNGIFYTAGFYFDL